MSNRAQAYGVTIAPAAGARRWEARDVWHLAPAENNGNHHVFVEVLDESGPGETGTGARAFGRRVRLGWAGGSTETVVDKDGVHGADLPLYKKVVASVGVVCEAGEVTDVVHGLHTMHPDEEPGNSWGHHSFGVVFQLQLAGGVIPSLPPVVPPVVEPPPVVKPPDLVLPSVYDDAAPAKYFTWFERSYAGLNVAMYRLYRLALGRPGLVSALTVDVDDVRRRRS